MSDFTCKSETHYAPEPVWEVGRWYRDRGSEYDEFIIFMLLGGPDVNGWVKLFLHGEPVLTQIDGQYYPLPIKDIDESGNAILDG